MVEDTDSNVDDHLRNHIHLTNCVHLKNHMHKHSPIMAERAFMRDLAVLQRSRSLRDPSASPSSWHSPSVTGGLLGRRQRDDLVRGRRSLSIEHVSGGTPLINAIPMSNSDTCQSGRHNEDSTTAAVNDCGSKHVTRPSGNVVREELNGRLTGLPLDANDLIRGPVSGNSEAVNDCGSKHVTRPSGNVVREELNRRLTGLPLDANDLIRGPVSGNSELGDKGAKIEGRYRQDRHLKTLSEQLQDIAAESDDAASSHNHGSGRDNQIEKTDKEAGAADICRVSGQPRAKRHRSLGARRRHPSRVPQKGRGQNETLDASNLFTQGRDPLGCHVEDGLQKHNDRNVGGVPRNVCGIPWNWLGIHNGGKSFLDLAGRRLSCGLSESRLRKGGSTSRGLDIPDVPVTSELSGSSTKSDVESLPLLLDASGSRGSIDHSAWSHDYSGELGIFSDNLLNRETDSDLGLGDRSREHHKFQERRNGRHKNITHKYMPRTFRDLVGQNLVVQALSNTIVKRKVGSLYLFYGPHGTGKTSCARIFSGALNCQSLEHPKPCGFCKPCIAHNTGKNRNVREIGPVSTFGVKSIYKLFENVTNSQLQSQNKVFIFDDCDTLASECWSVILKIIDQAPRRIVFILVCSSLEALPHLIISRCQRFFFPKLKDADIIYTLQWIASREDLQIDKDALKLIASRSDGSLRDAEMTLEQLSLLGKKISIDLVQELVGLVPDDKLVDLLDLSLSADTVNTVKNLRDIMESGVDPLALMSQLATVITDILAGSYNFLKERPGRKFFRRQGLSKEDMEKLRQALTTLSEAEKQLRASNDRITWLTAALLQLAPDQQYTLLNSSADASVNCSSQVVNGASLFERPRRSSEKHTLQAGSSGNFSNAKFKSTDPNEHKWDGAGVVSQQVHQPSNDKSKMNNIRLQSASDQEIAVLWLEVLRMVPVDSVREFLYAQGRLISISLGSVPTAQLLFNSELTKSKAEKFTPYISKAFESVLNSPVVIELRCESRKYVGMQQTLSPASQDPCRMDVNPHTGNRMSMISDADVVRFQNQDPSSSAINRREIVEIEASPRGKGIQYKDNEAVSDRLNIGYSAGVPSATQNLSILTQETNQSLSLVRSRTSLASMIQQPGESSQQSGWSRRQTVSIAEKLEQENLNLEPRSRSLLCWNPPRGTCRKRARVRIRVRKPQALLKIISCGRCLSDRSPRQQQSS